MISLKDGAIFVADIHYSPYRSEALNFFRAIQKKEIVSPQLFLLGDIFDFLAIESSFSVAVNRELIELLNALDTELIYLEGNHDFNLKELFPKALVIERKRQPLFLSCNNQVIAISHGDKYTSLLHEAYFCVVSNHTLLKILDWLDNRLLSQFIAKKLFSYLASKKICKEIDSFECIAQKRTQKLNCDLIIEGHFHQGKMLSFGQKRYINLPSFACNKSYFKLKLKDNAIMLQSVAF